MSRNSKIRREYLYCVELNGFMVGIFESYGNAEAHAKRLDPQPLYLFDHAEIKSYYINLEQFKKIAEEKKHQFNKDWFKTDLPWLQKLVFE